MARGVYHLDRPEVRYEDIVLPVADCFFRGSGFVLRFGRFLFPQPAWDGTGEKLLRSDIENHRTSWTGQTDRMGLHPTGLPS